MANKPQPEGLFPDESDMPGGLRATAKKAQQPPTPPPPVEPEVIEEDEPVVPTSMIAYDSMPSLSLARTKQAIEMAKERLIEQIEAMKVLKMAALSFTNHNDWIFHNSESGEPLPYLQDQGTEKLMHCFGVEMEIQGTNREEHEDTGTYEIVVFGRVRAIAFSPIWYPIVGSRWSGDGFFDKGIRTDPGDVRKAAFTSFYNRGVKKVLGLRGLTEDDLKKVPTIDASKIRRVTYSEGGGSRGANITDIVSTKHIACFIPYENESARNIFKKLKGSRFFKEEHPIAKKKALWVVPYSEAAEKQCADLVAMDGKVYWKVFEPSGSANAQA